MHEFRLRRAAKRPPSPGNARVLCPAGTSRAPILCLSARAREPLAARKKPGWRSEKPRIIRSISRIAGRTGQARSTHHRNGRKGAFREDRHYAVAVEAHPARARSCSIVWGRGGGPA